MLNPIKNPKNNSPTSLVTVDVVVVIQFGKSAKFHNDFLVYSLVIKRGIVHTRPKAQQCFEKKPNHFLLKMLPQHIMLL
jgi:hypothetical protein